MGPAFAIFIVLGMFLNMYVQLANTATEPGRIYIKVVPSNENTFIDFIEPDAFVDEAQHLITMAGEKRPMPEALASIVGYTTFWYLVALLAAVLIPVITSLSVTLICWRMRHSRPIA